MGWIATRIVEYALLPPLSVVLIGLTGVVLSRYRPRIGGALVLASLAMLYGASMPLVGRALMASTQTIPALAVEDLRDDLDAIVVLGAGVYAGAQEYGGDTLSGGALERLRYAVFLYRKTGIPILVTGGTPEKTSRSEAALMKEVLEVDFSTPVRWAENRSVNTYENAVMSYELLAGEDLVSIYLVTHSSHMPRAISAFEAAGFDVTPAPIRFVSVRSFSIRDLFPQTSGLAATNAALHELLGRLWYWVSGRGR